MTDSRFIIFTISSSFLFGGMAYTKITNVNINNEPVYSMLFLALLFITIYTFIGMDNFIQNSRKEYSIKSFIAGIIKAAVALSLFALVSYITNHISQPIADALAMLTVGAIWGGLLTHAWHQNKNYNKSLSQTGANNAPSG